jgi:hypothetical protein
MSTERDARLRRWHELWAELEQAEAFRVRGRFQLFGLSFRTLEGNYQELMASLEAMRSQPIPDDLGTPVGSDWIMPLFEIICRRLHNYLAAASSLIDHMRVLYREIYQPSGLIPGYQAEVDARFKNNGLARLVNGLRNVNLHCHHLVITYRQKVQVDRSGPSMTCDVFLIKQVIMTYDKLDPAARAFLESSGDEIGLESVIRTYHLAAAEFHEWLAARQHEIHGEAFSHLERIEQELREIKAAEKAYFDELLPPIGQGAG